MAQGKEPIQNKPGGSTKDPTITNYNSGISPFATNVGQESFFRSGDKTNLDLTNPNPFGGPINASRYQHQHLYTPENTYLDKFQEAASPNSNFGINGDEVQNNSIFEKTSLDIENPGPTGGPNTTNAYNIPNGSYTNNRSGNKFGESVGGPLKNKKGKIVNNFLQQYSSKNTYLNSLDGVVNNIPPPPPQPSVPTTPTVDNILPKIPKDIGGGN
jgi:hypothetical protein